MRRVADQWRPASSDEAYHIVKQRLFKDADAAALDGLNEAGDELKTALLELRELARGIHPAILTEAGLGPAIDSLAARSSVPAEVIATIHRMRTGAA